MAISASYRRDANRIPITDFGVISQKSQTLSGNNTTVTTGIFRITGSILVTALWGEVTTDIGANHTAAAWRLNDQTAQIYISAVAGTTLSAIKTGSIITRNRLAGTALTKMDNVAGVMVDPTEAFEPFFVPFLVVKKTGANTDIEYKYTTTDTPTTGAILHNLGWIPMSQDADVTVL